MPKRPLTKPDEDTRAKLPGRRDPVLGKLQLTPKQQAFVREYLKDHNATQAAKRAGYSQIASAQAGYELVRKPEIRAEIDRLNDELMAEARRIAGLSLERLTLEVARGAFFDPRKLVHADGRPKELHELDDDTASAIAGIELEELYAGRGDERTSIGRIHKFKLVDRKAFVDMGLKVLGAYKDDNSQRNPGEALTEFLKGMKRSALPVVAEVEQHEGL